MKQLKSDKNLHSWNQKKVLPVYYKKVAVAQSVARLLWNLAAWVRSPAGAAKTFLLFNLLRKSDKKLHSWKSAVQLSFNKSSYTLQQHAFLKNKSIPSIFDWECLKGIAFWFVPLFLFGTSLFMMSFSNEASHFLPFLMAALIHPIVIGKIF